MRKSNKYSDEFKEKVVEDYLNGSESTDKIAMKYHIRSSTQVKDGKINGENMDVFQITEEKDQQEDQNGIKKN
ncbi:hypothetical protein CI105_08390 [Candidatus Izimaplasma bacterium ZiA1]|uniref:hypothetical protein n=1 Tax=Candidatus Izimoplasma sp. ZiA1 TaxID=2024899 RepID=UPI000BAA85AA|nr:hypothetical protein CI105_08390 [Candidatus Izimaplasma bacterium ZiA1]